MNAEQCAFFPQRLLADRLALQVRIEHLPESEEYGIAWRPCRARRPFHRSVSTTPSRTWDNGRLLRSKGFFGLASRYREAGNWSQAGR
jgi:G3E family GTPase